MNSPFNLLINATTESISQCDAQSRAGSMRQHDTPVESKLHCLLCSWSKAALRRCNAEQLLHHGATLVKGESNSILAAVDQSDALGSCLCCLHQAVVQQGSSRIRVLDCYIYCIGLALQSYHHLLGYPLNAPNILSLHSKAWHVRHFRDKHLVQAMCRQDFWHLQQRVCGLGNGLFSHQANARLLTTQVAQLEGSSTPLLVGATPSNAASALSWQHRYVV